MNHPGWSLDSLPYLSSTHSITEKIPVASLLSSVLANRQTDSCSHHTLERICDFQVTLALSPRPKAYLGLTGF